MRIQIGLGLDMTIIIMFRATYQIGVGTTIAAYCAHTKTATKVTLPTDSELFPHGVAGNKVRELRMMRVMREPVTGAGW